MGIQDWKLDQEKKQWRFTRAEAFVRLNPSTQKFEAYFNGRLIHTSGSPADCDQQVKDLAEPERTKQWAANRQAQEQGALYAIEQAFEASKMPEGLEYRP